MTTNVGNYDISTLLAARFQSVAEYGLDTIQRVLESDLAAHNAIVQDMVAGLCEITTDRQRIYGTSAHGEMVEVDEYGRAPTQVIATGATCGFPLKLFQFALGWTEKWLQTHTPAEMAAAVLSAEEAHLRRVQLEIKYALFRATNFTFNDHLVDKVDLSVKRLINADSSNIPDGPNGETFDGATHTHYDANATLTANVSLAAIEDVVEHGHGNQVKLAINRANEAAFKALTGFTAYADPRIIYRATDTPGQTLDLSRLDNRAVGVFSSAEVWVKPWVPANYLFAWDAGSPNKPLAFRQRSNAALQGLRIAAELGSFPLNARYMEAEFGIGVWTRTNGACLRFNDAAWADPV